MNIYHLPPTTYHFGSSIVYKLAFDCLPIPRERLDALTPSRKGAGAQSTDRQIEPRTY